MLNQKIVTHSGSFHPDDVFAVAALRLAFGGDLEVVRTRDPEVIKIGGFVIDVGGVSEPESSRFDHHQKGGAGRRPNGVPFASFGLVWKEFGEKICGSKEIADRIDLLLVQPIDATDNGEGRLREIFPGVYPFRLEDIIDSFNLTWREKEENIDEVFDEVVSLAEEILSREIKIVKDEAEGAIRVEKAYELAEDKRVIVLDANYKWQRTLEKYKEPFFVVEPSSDGKSWKAEALRTSFFSYQCRRKFPEEWAGKRNGELQETAGVADAVFCHNSGFLAAAKSKEGAIRLAMKALSHS